MEMIFLNNKNVTIVIDGQAGSCGKGKICGYLSKNDNFSLSTNNWSSNAGHTYVEDNGEKIVASHLPIAMLNPNCKLVLNAGCIITPEILAGLSPFKVKDIYMIIRPYPIRISNKTNIGEDIYSGDYAGSAEITWNEVKDRCGCNIALEEYTTVTKKIRRVFEMNWDRLKYNVMIN